ncbi:MAG: c-type cytochrome, partial [Planctomycetales bacterium]|nr:c-type cytochrome [Planctomycetales bacterium]
DGSLIVADWYDPGVGGHGMGDTTRGRLFRVTRPGQGGTYKIPKFDFATASGAVLALQNPNYAARYLAWQALHKMGVQAEAALAELSHSERPEFRARALWLLGKIPGRGLHYCEIAANDADPRIRGLAIRLARQLSDVNTLSLVEKLVQDESPAVRRECAIALRDQSSDQRSDQANAQVAALWADLATQYDGQDRWYLEALGIGAHGRWDECLAAYTTKLSSNSTGRAASGSSAFPWSNPGARDLAWRSRGSVTAQLLQQALESPELPANDVLRFVRAIDFLDSNQRDQISEALAFSTKLGDDERSQRIRAEAVSRLNPAAMKNDPARRTQIESILDLARGTRRFVELVRQFNLTERYPEIVSLAREHSADSLGIDATRLLLDANQWDLIQAELSHDDEARQQQMIAALGNSGHNRAVPSLERVTSGSGSSEIKRLAVKNMAKIRAGAELLLKQAEAQTLSPELVAAAASELHQAPWRDIKSKSLEILPLAASKDNRPVPAVRDLVRARGNAERGHRVFLNQGTCHKCHIVRGEGKQVGPELSEIGSKLSRDAMFESILYPSAGIAHSYETYTAELADGNVVTGLLVSETAEEVELKNNEGVVRNIARADIDSITKQPISIMPADLHQSLTEQELVDLVEFLTTLKAAK